MRPIQGQLTKRYLAGSPFDSKHALNLHPTIKPMLVFSADPYVLWNRLIDPAQGCPNHHVYRRGMFPSPAAQTGECVAAFPAIGQLICPGLHIDAFSGSWA